MQEDRFTVNSKNLIITICGAKVITKTKINPIINAGMKAQKGTPYKASMNLDLGDSMFQVFSSLCVQLFLQ